MSKAKFVPEQLKTAKLLAWKKLKFLNVVKLQRRSKAAVVVDKTGKPKLFLMDTSAFLDLLSTIDEPLLEKLSSEEYNSKSVNPAGWLIDEIEAKLPLKSKFISSLEKALEESNKKGWIPFSELQIKLGLE